MKLNKEDVPSLLVLFVVILALVTVPTVAVIFMIM
jgi:hypothetical protein